MKGGDSDGDGGGGDIIDVVGRKNIVCWGVNMVT
jgi:hypothetical protein